MPLGIASDEYERQLERAAWSSRLNPGALHAREANLFKDRLSGLDVKAYLTARNGILRLWTRNPLVAVTREEACQCASQLNIGLALVAYEWLARNGYINFGCVEIPTYKFGNVSSLPNRRKTIVIIGAGISGLTCARQLESLFEQFPERWKKHRRENVPKVILLEGRDRIGGRVYSHPFRHQQEGSLPHGLSNTAEMGAQIITGFDGGNPLDIVVRGQLALEHHYFNPAMQMYDIDGSPVEQARDDRMMKLFDDFLETASAHRWKPNTNITTNGVHKVMLVHPDPTQSLPTPESEDAVDVSPKVIVDDAQHPTLGAHLDRLLEQYQNNIKLEPLDLRLLNWHYANMEYANAVNVDQLSLGGWDQDSGNEFEGAHSHIIGGYTQVPRALMEYPSRLDIHKNKIVSRVLYGGKDMMSEVQCLDGTTYQADEVIITVSLGVLQQQRIAFNPPLPEWKQGAIDRLGFGLLNKIILVFDHVFWDPGRDMFGQLNDGDISESLSQKDYVSKRGQFYMFWNCTKTSGKPILVGLMAGDSAEQAEKTSNQALIEHVTAKLARMFNLPKVPMPLEAVITRWRRDPFAGGSYSYLGPKAQPGDYDSMARPVENLHFAGEATCGTHPATVHGAFLSGLRAASEIVEKLIGEIPLPVKLASETHTNGETNGDWLSSAQ